jgi:hypothetical protein
MILKAHGTNIQSLPEKATMHPDRYDLPILIQLIIVVFSPILQQNSVNSFSTIKGQEGGLSCRLQAKKRR